MDNTHKDYFFNDKVVLPFDKVIAWQKAIYMKLGMSEHDASIVADHLVVADARGVYSHGIMRTPIYAKRMECGGTSATAQPEIIKQFGATALVDAHNAMGQVAGVYAMDHAIELAKQYGTSAVSVTGSNHLGTCAYYAQRASKQGMIGICWTINGGNNMAPWGGSVPQLGNNPYAMAAPCFSKPDVVMDMATSVVARGKIVMARKTHAKIPETWALDKDGNPTTDPEAA
ncbi:MAG: Ldh family oxidoreductase, partial [Sphaerochaetaceae bacterium]